MPVGGQHSPTLGLLRHEGHDQHLVATGAVELVAEPLHVVEKFGPLSRLVRIVAVDIAGLPGRRVEEDVRTTEVTQAGGKRDAEPVGDDGGGDGEKLGVTCSSRPAKVMAVEPGTELGLTTQLVARCVPVPL